MRKAWTDAETEELRRYCRETSVDNFDSAEIAAKFGRTVNSVNVRISRLGLGDPCRKFTTTTREKMSSSQKRRMQTVGHPNKGTKFGPLKQEQKKAMSRSIRATFDLQRSAGVGMFSEASRDKKSDLAVLMQIDRRKRGWMNYSRAKQGKRDDIGIYVRSSWEANIARYLNWLKARGQIHEWKYEADTFWFHAIKRGTRSYTPDFKIWDRPNEEPYYWEVKGWMDQKSRTKLARMAKYYPNAKVVLIDKAGYTAIRNSISALIPGWEGR